MLYFGYGSNLCERDWGEWCERNGAEKSGLRFLRRAWLPEHELSFTYSSASRGGGVLDVIERFGQAVPGALFEIDEACKLALDKKEGAPFIYEPAELTVLDDEGGAHTALTYRVKEDLRVAHVEAAPGYAEIVSEGCEALGVKKSMLTAAAAVRRPAWEIPSVFVYGSLRTGESNHGWLKRGAAVKLKGVGSTPGLLHDCGSWPAMMPGSGEERVVGELWRCEDAGATLGALDQLEGFSGWSEGGSLFLRRLQRARMSCGGEVLTWVYRYAGERCDGELVSSGDWTSR
jgi:gamma-glutamylcyclotransferase (GGCT)/AIG2-like uncharacterized protein YtfP